MSIKLLIVVVAILIGIILLATTACLKAANRADIWEKELEKNKYKKSKEK